MKQQALTTSMPAVTTYQDRHAPIGLFDSGVGGLSVYKHLAQQLPAERYVYYADTLHVPYGNRDSQDIEALTLIAVEWLYQQGCKLIVIACNSASAYALDAARRHYPLLPIVGLVPALKPAVLASKSGHVAVLATKATLNGTLLNQVIADIAASNHTLVTKYFDPELVPWVEAGMPTTAETAQRLRQQLGQFADDKIDYLVLGCTHYPFFKDFLIHNIAAQQLSMHIVDSGYAIAARVQYLLAERDLLAELPCLAPIEQKDVHNNHIVYPLTFYASKYDNRLSRLVRRLLGSQILIKLHCN
ncbi:glutamate racemase [Psychrobacter urativorans]|uniref:glutamate racemase n=1 Tax=Psychrobacter urativorans TaxID=45610 RepID=UPI001918F478|nr:glutamate racemase [Psychrobacter urativorans]